jgi:2-polyprenyl-3-methyl-5-hydroxy-6-metoxy-1,4-benzoquinol methylase
MSSLGICPACGATGAATLPVKHRFLRHMDYASMRAQSGRLSKCAVCQMVFMDDPVTLAEQCAMYEGVDYAGTKTSPYVVYAANGSAASTTYDAMAEILAARTRLGGKRVLDFGCFHGKLLEALSRHGDGLECHGYDVSPAIAALFPKKPNFTYWSGDSGAIPGTFDLIAVVNALMYVNDVRATFDYLEARLSPEGAVFVVVPDCARNPQALLYGDQRTFYTPVILGNLAARYGLAIEFIAAPAFPRSIVALCRRASTGAARGLAVDDAPERSLVYLDTARDRLGRTVSDYRTRNVGKIAVLGVSPNAAWAGQVLDGAVDLYVDENPGRTGTRFCGHPVAHPSTLGRDDLIVLPYGDTAAPIAAKFAKKYVANLLVV